MSYLKEVFDNFKANTPIFTIIGVLAALLIGISGFKQDLLPRFLSHYYLLIYLYILLFLVVLTLTLCLLVPLFLSIKESRLWGLLLNASKVTWPSHNLMFICFLALTTFGIVMIYSFTAAAAKVKLGDEFYFLKRQVFWVIIGLSLMSLLSRLNLFYINKLAKPLMVTCIILLTVGLRLS